MTETADQTSESSVSRGGALQGTMDEVGYRAVFRAAPDGILLVGPDGRIRDMNPKAEELFGWERDELTGEPVEALVPEGARHAHSRHREHYHDEPRPRPMGIGMELTGRRSDGTEFPVEISLSPVRQDGVTYVIAVVRDVTERNRLRDFGAGALRATEEERRRIARELHDDVAQRVAAMVLRLELARRADSESGRDALLDRIREDLSDCSDAIRRLARGLRPPALEDAGLAAALRSHVRERLKGASVDSELDVDGLGPDVGRDLQLVVYRIVQEALSNVVRHADADRVRIDVQRLEDRIVVEVEDDGRGFEHAGPSEVLDHGLGLIGMEERAHAVGGELEIETAPGEGTCVRMEVPLAGGERPRSRGSGHG